MPENEIEAPMNRHLVGVQADHVTVLSPWGRMTARQAAEYAAWLVAMAEVVDPSVDFAAMLAAVKGA